MGGRSVSRSSKKRIKRIRNFFFSLARSTQLATMADALLSIAVEKLTQVLGRERSLFAGANRELEKLRDTFQSIQALLADAERRQAEDESVKLWLSRLRGVAYDIDDLLDDWVISGLEERAEEEAEHGRNKVSACLLSPFTTLDHVASRYTIAHRITEIRKRLDHIHGEKNRYSFSSSSGDGQGQLISKRPYTGSLIEEVMIGRDQDKAEIINRLECGSSSENGQVQVIAIVGIAGLGKTTLAREIYNDSSLCKHFDLFSWACVTEVFNVAKVIKAILHGLKENTTTDELSPLQKQLCEKLDGKRFLVVLDDVWNEDEEKWNTLRASFKSGAAGSRILVTARSLKVTNIMNAVHISELQGLSEDDSWRLFSSRAFAGRNDKDRFDFQAVGRQIVSKFNGVPLSIKVMGSAMNGKTSVEDWQKISESKMWSLPEAKSKILPALWLSYYNLPPHLKPCFVYCSIFPKDTVMEKDQLVKLWVAQGFIHAQGNREVENIAAEYFDHLLERSMFQEASDDRSRCKIHDLLHDLAEHITKDETYVYVGEKPNQCPTSVRHASFVLSENNLNINLISLCGAKTLRTLFLSGYDRIDTGLDNIFLHARLLRALDFRSAEIKTLPRTIGNLKHLRYLDLSESWIVELPNVIGKMKYLKYLNLHNSKLFELPNAIGNLKYLTYLDLSNSNIVELPDSLTRLHKLHTLKLNRCSELKKLPTGMGGMVGLRHLEIENTDCLEHLPKEMGRMISLKSLCKFIVDGEGGCKINELQQLNDLQGNLTIEHLERVPSRHEAMKAELWKKQNLHKLVLKMSSDRDEEVGTSARYVADNVLEGLRPHENLNELQLVCNRRNSKLPSWLENSSFTKLTKLEIQGVVIRCEQNNLAGLGKLPALKYLKMQNVDVKKVGREWYYGNSSNDVVARGIKMAFPKLEQLQFICMPELEKWELILEFDEDVNIMPHLSDLRLQDCPKLEGLPHHLVNAPLTNLELSGCHRLKGTRCSSSFPHLGKFTLRDSSEFLSIGLPHLPKLKEFFIRRIRNETLPNEGWELLLVLQQLKIEDCIELKSLPNGLTQLPSLRDLRIHRCDKIESLPEGLGQLRKLRSLVLYSLESLPYLSDSLGQLESLESLNILYLKKLKLLPEGLRQLKKLQSLKLYGLDLLTYLPNSFGQLESLEHLDIYDLKNLQSLPEMLQQLKKLKSLHIRNAEALTRFPDSLAQLELLEKLNISGLKKLKSLPKGIGELKKLKSLRINDTEALICLPNSLPQLESLEQLDISGLKKLKSLPEGLGQLKKLKSLEISNAEALSCLPNSLAQLESLEQLDISALKKLKLLPEGLEQLKKLKSLKISDTEELICLPDSLGQLESLEYFEIIGLAKLESLPHSLIQLKKLKALTIENIEALINIPKSLRQLESLETLTISQCQKLKSLPCQFGRLESLIIGPLQARTCLSNTLEQVNSLKELRICGLKELESLPCWLVQLKALRELHIFDCIALRSLPYWLKDLPLLQELYVRGCPQLSEKYKKEGGDDWPKILQIPIIKIDGRRI